MYNHFTVHEEKTPLNRHESTRSKFQSELLFHSFVSLHRALHRMAAVSSQDI